MVTVGDLGCCYKENLGDIQSVIALQVNVIDTTGCGNVFHGAFAAYMVRRESIPRTIRVTSVTAGVKPTCTRGYGGIPELQRVEHFLEVSKNIFI